MVPGLPPWLAEVSYQMVVQIQNGTAANNKKTTWYKDVRLIRHGVMLFFFLFLLHVAYDHQVKGGGPRGTPSVEAYCPFGGVENLYYFLTTGGYIRRIEPSAMVLFAALVLLTLLFSRGFCGWVCPFGSLQEWIGILGRKIFGKSYNPTGVWEKRLRYLKYVILAVIIGFTWHLGTLVFRPYDPFLAFFHLGKSVDEMPWAYAALGVVLLGSLKYERFFCKYACPLGAVIGILGKLGITKIQRETDGCKGCNLCQKKCFAHVDFLSTTVIKDAECNHCLDCTVHCPKPNVLSLKGARWRFSHPVYAALLIAGLFAVIGTSKLSGYWRTKPEMVKLTNNAGKLDPEQIRGWMTLNDISSGYGIPLEKLYSEAKLPAHVSPDLRINEISGTYNLKFEPDRLRDVVRTFLGEAPKGKAAAPPAEKGQKKGDHAEAEVKGFMTLNEVAIKTGVPKEWLLKRLGAPANVDPRKPLREWMHEAGKSIQDVRDAVADYRAGRR